MAEHETIADIIAEKRFDATTRDQFDSAYIVDFCDRLEAAHKREKAAIEADALAVGGIVEAARKRERGDRAKLREALKHIKDRLPHMLQYMRVHWEDANAGGYFDELMLVIDAALAASPRNCDMGTEQEQAERYVRYCDEFTRDGMHCETCPCCGKIPFGKCEFAWAQMPYEADEKGGAE